MIQPQFIEAGDFKDGVAAVKQDAKWGYIDYNGNYFIDPQFDHAKDFENGVGIVREKGIYKYVNSNKEIFPANKEYEALKEFSNGFARIRQGKLWGYINQSGQIVIPAQFIDAGNFYGCGNYSIVFSNLHEKIF